MNKCKVCGKETKNKAYCSLECRYKDSYFKYYTWNTKENLENNPELAEKFYKGHKKSRETYKKRYKKGKYKVWNYGLTKDNNEILRKMGEKRRGKNNPIHKLLQDKEKTKKWKQNIGIAIKGKNVGTYEERYGEEKAIEIKEKQRKSAKKRKIHGHSGKKTY